MKNKVFSTMLLGAAVPIVSGEAAEFIPLGSLAGNTGSSAALDLSADGSTVLGRSDSTDGQQLFRWNFETGFSIIPSFDPGPSFPPNFFATSISGDGSSVAGYAFTGTTLEALKWSAANGFIQLGILPSDGGFEMSLAVDISGDGNSVVGYGSAPVTPASAALLWTSSMGLTSLGFLPDDQPDGLNTSQSFSYAISADGSTVVGSSSSTTHEDRGSQAFRWTQGEGMVPLGILAGEFDSTATAVSVDGSVIVGTSGLNAFRWTAAGGMEAIGQFLPTAVSADGNVVVGTSHFRDLAMIWTPATSAQPLQTYLQGLNVTLPGWQALYEVVGVSADGTAITGTGLNASGLTEAFLATLASSVQSTGAVSFSGPVSLFLVDPDGKRYGTNPENGEFLNEIPELTLTEENATKTAAWTDIVSGDHLVYFTGTSAGNYDVSFEFLHLDNETSGASFTGELLKGGVHIYAAHVSSDTHEDAHYQLIYADTDGDKVPDSSDAVLKSDTRCTIFVGSIDTGVKNRVLANGTTLNDVITCQLKKSTSRGSFVSVMNDITRQWVSAGLITKAGATVIHDATTNVTR
jgi:probable HAF family extracellular repeat protein